jgi:hypothetical protein
LENYEEKIVESADTVQWFIKPDGVWRIRTYGIDKDIHVHEIHMSGEKIDFVRFAKEHTDKHYGDLISKEIHLKSDNGIVGLKQKFELEGYSGQITEAKDGFMFWSSGDGEYRTKSTPK